MVTVPTYSMSGVENGSIDFDSRFFDLPENPALLKEVYVSLSANERVTIAHTKGRGERAGSGKKPWKQKHTGRARAGSVRSPLWRKGGIVFGPKSEQNFSKKINRKAKGKAFFIALSGKIRDKELIIVDSLSLPDAKTKLFAQSLTSLNLSRKSIVLGLSADEYSIERVARNVPKLISKASRTLNVKDMLDHRFVLMSRASVLSIAERAEKLFS